jgi:DNA polymerase-3 subunit alpha
VTPTLASELRRIVETHPGSRPLRIRLDGAQGRSTLLAIPNFSVDPSSAFMGDIKSLLGVGSIVV